MQGPYMEIPADGVADDAGAVAMKFTGRSIPQQHKEVNPDFCRP